MKRPAFKHHFQVQIDSGEGVVYLLSETGHYALSGRLYPALAPLLNGTRSPDNIAASLRGRFSALEIYHALETLAARGYLTEAQDGFPVAEASFWNALNLHADAVATRKQQAKIEIVDFGAFDAGELNRHLESLDLQVGTNGTFSIVLVKDYLDGNLADFNRSALAGNRPWLLAKPVGSVLWIGPIFVPGTTGCWDCLAQRLRMNREVEARVQASVAAPEALALSRSRLDSTMATALSITATETAKWIAGGKSAREGAILTLDTATMATCEHTLIRRPQCPACGDSGGVTVQDFQPVQLKPAPTRFSEDGGYRTLHPAETFERFKKHISPVTGVVTALHPAPGSDSEAVSIYFAGHAFAAGSAGLAGMRTALRNKSAGKGISDVQAKVSGLCEAIERYSMQYFGDEARVRTSMKRLGESAVHPNDCMLFSEAQYRQRHDAGKSALDSSLVPEPFDPESELDWTPLWSLARQQVRYLPMSYCYYGYRDQGAYTCHGDSNGNAAGNTIEEAILQGFLELVERDSIAIWWYNQIPRPALDLDSFADPYCNAMLRHYHSLGREISVIDITGDFGIATFAAASFETGTQEAVILGYGSHLDPKIALQRAITELNQSLHLQKAALTGPTASNRELELLHFKASADTGRFRFLFPDSRLPKREKKDFFNLATDDLRDDVESCVALAKARGLDFLVLDQTRPDIGMSVVKVVIPGLWPAKTRLAPGRLYQVPVTLGWLEKPLREEEMNPVSPAM